MNERQFDHKGSVYRQGRPPIRRRYLSACKAPGCLPPRISPRT